ncbi:hypothetical protein [Actinoplanes sp. NPDC051851]|uniref:hypothetical protein n=1 Tax=Actinoplanes sp. NPDC051851 TaxID=3154753 RepID=UPI00341B275C
MRPATSRILAAASVTALALVAVPRPALATATRPVAGHTAVRAGAVPTVAQMTKGLIARADLPAGYTLGETVDGVTSLAPGDRCDPLLKPDRGKPSPFVAADFTTARGASGNEIIIATGAAVARDHLKALAAVPVKCPTTTTGKVTVRVTRTPLPVKSGIAVTVSTKGEDGSGTRVDSYILGALVTSGEVCAFLTLMNATPADSAPFTKLVTAATAKLKKIK